MARTWADPSRVAAVAAGLILAGWGVAGCGVHREPQAQAPPALSEWTVVEVPEPRTATARCANHGMNRWRVALTSTDRLVIGLYSHPGDVPRDSLVYDDGVLFAIDRGEFGGRALWRSSDGTERTLFDSNVRYLFDSVDAVHGFGGIAHMILNRGYFLTFERDDAGEWQRSSSTDLGAAPLAVARIAMDTFLVGTLEDLRLVTTTGEVEVIHRSPIWFYTSVTSVIRKSDGTIFVGMTSAVARLSPTPSGYHEEWFVPRECAETLSDGSHRLGCQCSRQLRR